MDVTVGTVTPLVFDDSAPVRAASAVVPFGGGWLVAQDARRRSVRGRHPYRSAAVARVGPGSRSTLASSRPSAPARAPTASRKAPAKTSARPAVSPGSPVG